MVVLVRDLGTDRGLLDVDTFVVAAGTREKVMALRALRYKASDIEFFNWVGVRRFRL
jgi:hypothetical protein